jgi:uncharacterized protein
VTPSSGSSSGSEAAAIALAFVDALASGATDKAEAMEAATVRNAAPAAALGQLWSQLQGKFGAFAATGEVTVASAAPFENATITAYFANATVPLIVTIDVDGNVAGLHLGQPGPAASPPGGPGGSGGPGATVAPSPVATPAAYVKPEVFTETDVTVGKAPWALPGTLSMPKGAGPFPAVILLAGSGPQDRDETIGPNKPLRDLAWGLASNGIAVLRYEKRTTAYGAKMAADPTKITVHQETMDDAEAAISLLRATAGIDPARIVIAGHSLGGYLAPRIATEVPGRLAGIALIEAPTSSFQHLVLAQFEYLASPEGGANPNAVAQLPTIRTQVALVESGKVTASTPASELPLGVPAAYWLDLRGYNPAATAKKLAIPIFITQGGRDYQVPPTELAGWRTALASRTDVSIHQYPALNHLLMAGSGPARPAEFAVPGHVAPELVADLVAWVIAIGR